MLDYISQQDSMCYLSEFVFFLIWQVLDDDSDCDSAELDHSCSAEPGQPPTNWWKADISTQMSCTSGQCVLLLLCQTLVNLQRQPLDEGGMEWRQENKTLSENPEYRSPGCEARELATLAQQSVFCSETALLKLIALHLREASNKTVCSSLLSSSMLVFYIYSLIL